MILLFEKKNYMNRKRIKWSLVIYSFYFSSIKNVGVIFFQSKCVPLLGNARSVMYKYGIKIRQVIKLFKSKFYEFELRPGA